MAIDPTLNPKFEATGNYESDNHWLITSPDFACIHFEEDYSRLEYSLAAIEARAENSIGKSYQDQCDLKFLISRVKELEKEKASTTSTG